MQNKRDRRGGGVAAAWAACEGIAPREVDGARFKAVVLGDALRSV